jgi:hypothetical protein
MAAPDARDHSSVQSNGIEADAGDAGLAYQALQPLAGAERGLTEAQLGVHPR